MKTDPSNARGFYQSINDILKAFKAGQIDGAMQKLNAILPEARRVVKEHEARVGLIYKDIAR